MKGAGDGILAAFDSASDGVAAAVAMQQAVHGIGRRRRLELAIRVGISVGDVSWEDGDCFGLPVVEAARLEAAAEPGQVLCAEIVRMLARGRAGVEFRPVGELLLKGLDEPVAACEIAWSPTDAGTRRDGDPVGRTLGGVGGCSPTRGSGRGGGGGAVLVAGEPGIGKTRLLQSSRRR